VNGDNIYDGRNKLQLLKLLVQDNLKLIERNRTLLSASEVKILEKEYILNLMNASKESLLTDKDVKKSIFYLLKAFSDHPRYSFDIFFQIVFQKFKNKQLQKADII
jgi:hypothetical protein